MTRSAPILFPPGTKHPLTDENFCSRGVEKTWIALVEDLRAGTVPDFVPAGNKSSVTDENFCSRRRNKEPLDPPAPLPLQGRGCGGDGSTSDRELGLEEIPDILAEVWGWRPTSAQVSRYLRMQGYPIPTIRSHRGLSARESAVRQWALDHESGARGGQPR